MANIKRIISNISSDDLKQIAIRLKDYIGSRAGGKTAIVSQLDFHFGMARIYVTYAQLKNLPTMYQTFRDIEKAKKWLQS